MTAALLVVPPLLKYLAGPLAGPVQLAGAAAAVGGSLQVLDLNAHWLRAFENGGSSSSIVGDHARPDGGFRQGAAAWWRLLADVLPAPDPRTPAGEDGLRALCYPHEEVERAAKRLAESPVARAWGELLPRRSPAFFGISVLWSGQVVAALALSIMARRRWPGVPVVWGGAHVTALAEVIAGDARFGRHVQGFVAGYAEATLGDMLRGDPLAVPEVFAAGCGRCPRAREVAVRPCFGDLSLYGSPRLILPVQVSRGCAYGRCAFCTYPHQEGSYRTLSLDGISPALELAVELGAQLAVKDALVTPPRLDALAARIAGRAEWAACTRLVPRLGRERLIRLAAAGLRTFELGVEALDPATLRGQDKPQPLNLLDGLLEDASDLPVHLVLNVMAGFPGQRLEDALAELQQLRHELPRRHPRARFSIERNLLQVERNSPLARRPHHFGIELTGSWPWSSVLGWNAPAWRADFAREWTGHWIQEAA